MTARRVAHARGTVRARSCARVGRGGVRGDGVPGAERPQLVDAFPERGHERVRGDAARRGLARQGRDGPAARARSPGRERHGEGAQGGGLRVPRPGRRRRGAASRASTWIPSSGAVRRRSTCRSLALPTEPGRHTLILPPLPVSVARANNDVVTLCTKAAHDRRRGSDRLDPERAAQAEPAAARRSARSGSRSSGALGWGAVGVLVGGALAWLLVPLAAAAQARAARRRRRVRPGRSRSSGSTRRATPGSSRRRASPSSSTA